MSWASGTDYSVDELHTMITNIFIHNSSNGNTPEEMAERIGGNIQYVNGYVILIGEGEEMTYWVMHPERSKLLDLILLAEQFLPLCKNWSELFVNTATVL